MARTSGRRARVKPFRRGFVSGPAASGILILDNTDILETATNPDAIGTLTVSGPLAGGPWTYSITSDPDAKFDIGGIGSDELIVESGAVFDYETQTTHLVTVRAIGPKVFTRAFIISVLDVAEGTNLLDFSDEANSQYIPLLGPLG